MASGRKMLAALAVILLACAGILLSQQNLLSDVQLQFGDPTPAPTPPPTVPPFDFVYPAVVEKKVVSSRMRLVFLVGLEGTGHHYLAQVFTDVCKAASVPCPDLCALATTIYPGMSKPKYAVNYERARRSLRKEMENLATFAEESVPKGKATMASFKPCTDGNGMMSYPNFNGDDKAIQYVDFRLVAEEAERAGVDLRIMYLSRSARSTLISDTEHHNYGKTFMRESRILINNADVIASTFQELGPGFTTCFRYEEMDDSKQASRIANFVAPNIWIAHRLQNKMLSNANITSPAQPTPPTLKETGPRVQWSEGRQQQEGAPHGDGEGKGGRRQLRHRGEEGVKVGVEIEIDESDPTLNYHHDHHDGVRALLPFEEGGTDNFSRELVVARLQQKLDKIERDFCSTMLVN